MKVKRELHLHKQGQYEVMPHTAFTLTKEERKKVCQWLNDVKFPDGYVSNIGQCVNLHEGKIMGLKSHNCHVLIQRLL